MADEKKEKTAKKAEEKIDNKMDKEKQKVLKLTIDGLEKKFGKGIVMKLGEKSIRSDVDIIPTGALTLDYAIGVGGVPRGRVIEIYGPESSGKTSLALSIVAQAQKKNGIAVYIDAEHALDVEYAKKIGVNVDELRIVQPDFGEQALEIAENLARSSAVDLIVVDSVAALVPRAELEGSMGDAHMGLQARLMGQALRKLAAVLSRSKTCCIFINQLREKIGVMFGNPETTPGGRALKFYASLRLDIRRIETLKKGENILGIRSRVKVVKNKVAPPFKKAEFDILYGEGISEESCLLDVAIQNNIIKKSGSWLSMGDARLGQGRDNVRELIKADKKLKSEIEKKVKALLSSQK